MYQVFPGSSYIFPHILVSIRALPRILSAKANENFWAGFPFLPAHAGFPPLLDLCSTYSCAENGSYRLCSCSVDKLVRVPAYNITPLLAGWIIQGICGGAMQVMSIIVVSDVYPIRRRWKYASAIHLAWGISAAVGPFMEVPSSRALPGG